MAPLPFKDMLKAELPNLIVASFIVTIFLSLCWLVSSFISWLGVVALLTGLHWISTAETIASSEDEKKRKDVFVVIVGAGYSGLCTAIKLKQAKIRYVVLEKSAGLGGTWWDNKYPGCACDIMSHLYSFSFFPNPFWSTSFPSQPEVLEYLEKVADHYDLRRNIRLNTRADTCVYNEEMKKWTVTTKKGEKFDCNFLVSAIGALHVPKQVSFPGKDTFEGKAFHTAEWDEDFDVTDKAIGVVGTGASAVQVVPAILSQVKSLHVFQRTAVWIVPRFDFAYHKFLQAIFHAFPLITKLHRWYIFLRQELQFFTIFGKGTKGAKIARKTVTKLMQRQLEDETLKEKMIPDFELGCKRITVSNGYVKAFNSPKVTLITDAIESITAKGIKVAGQPEEIELDAIVYATGFDLMASCKNISVSGVGGQDLAEFWGQKPNAYLGITCPKFPNLFYLLGPNVGLGHNSIIWMIECQVTYMMDAIVKATNQGIHSMEVKEDVNSKYQEEIQRLMTFRVFHSGCKSWYQNSDGFIYTLWPSHLFHYWWMTKACNFEDYITTK